MVLVATALVRRGPKYVSSACQASPTTSIFLKMLQNHNEIAYVKFPSFLENTIVHGQVRFCFGN